jgi:hypothetical protein
MCVNWGEACFGTRSMVKSYVSFTLSLFPFIFLLCLFLYYLQPYFIICKIIDFSSNIITVIESRRMKWAGHVARMEELEMHILI